MQRMKEHLADCSSCSSELRSLTKRLPTDEKEAAFGLLVGLVLLHGMSQSNWCLPPVSLASHSDCSVSLFFSSQLTSSDLVSLPMMAAEW